MSQGNQLSDQVAKQAGLHEDKVPPVSSYYLLTTDEGAAKNQKDWLIVTDRKIIPSVILKANEATHLDIKLPYKNYCKDIW